MQAAIAVKRRLEEFPKCKCTMLQRRRVWSAAHWIHFSLYLCQCQRFYWHCIKQEVTPWRVSLLYFRWQEVLVVVFEKNCHLFWQHFIRPSVISVCKLVLLVRWCDWIVTRVWHVWPAFRLSHDSHKHFASSFRLECCSQWKWNKHFNVDPHMNKLFRQIFNLIFGRCVITNFNASKRSAVLNVSFWSVGIEVRGNFTSCRRRFINGVSVDLLINRFSSNKDGWRYGTWFRWYSSSVVHLFNICLRAPKLRKKKT